MRWKSVLWVACFVSILFLPALAQKKQEAGNESGTIAKPMSEKDKRRQQERLRKELETPFKKWLQQDVGYIITDEERKAFRALMTDEEREQFVEQFWLRRDPSPDTEENEFREEHYRRVAYANQNFASGRPGWRSDRGMIYIKYGAADERRQHAGGSYNRPIEEGGGMTSVYPFEKWRYRYIEGIGTNVEIEFVDPTLTGEFRMTMNPTEKDALMMVPGAGLTLCEQMGQCDKTARFARTDGTRLGIGGDVPVASMNQFNRLDQFARLQAPPVVKFKDLEAAVNSTIKYNLLPMKVRADFIPITDSSVLANITIQFERKDLQFKQKEGVSTANVNIYGRITSMARRPVNWFEDVVSVDVPTDLLQEAVKGSSIYQKIIPLPPGRYRLNVAAKDIVGGNTTSFELALDVPRIEDGKLSNSSLILADVIEKVPTKSIGSGPFVIGTSKVRPRMSESFRRDEKLGIYVQVYNFEPDEKTRRPDGTIEYEILKAGSAEKVFEYMEQLDAIPDSAAAQVVVQKLLPLQSLEPGHYTLKMKITDKKNNQTLTPSANFTVT